MNVRELLKERLAPENYERLMALANPKMHEFVADAIALTKPASVFVCTDAPEDTAYIRKLAVENGEEISLATPGHTCHFDGYNDQARDKAKTKYLLPGGSQLGTSLNSIKGFRYCGGSVFPSGLDGGPRNAGLLLLFGPSRFGVLHSVHPDNGFSLCGSQRDDSLPVWI